MLVLRLCLRLFLAFWVPQKRPKNKSPLLSLFIKCFNFSLDIYSFSSSYFPCFSLFWPPCYAGGAKMSLCFVFGSPKTKNRRYRRNTDNKLSVLYFIYQFNYAICTIQSIRNSYCISTYFTVSCFYDYH